MSRLLSVLVALSCVGCTVAGNEEPAAKPTEKAIIEAFRSAREKPKGQTPVTIEVHAVKIGQTDVATAQEVVNGVPRGGMVTALLIDWTRRDHYTDATKARHMVTEAFAYKDKFGEWAVMTGSHRKDETFDEAPKKPK